MAYRIQFRRDTSTNWDSNNPILLPGEFGYELDTGFAKIGDGSSTWDQLTYFGGTGPTGPAGPTGSTGFTGATGATGTSGSSGTSGSNGTSGSSGTSGTSGSSGSSGSSGTSGSGFTVSSYGSNRILVSDNTPSGATAQSSLTFNGSILSLQNQKIEDVKDIAFTLTGPNPSTDAARLFYDSTQESLAYYPKTGSPLEILLGRELYTKVVNNSGSTLNRGTAVKIQSGTTGGIPEITAANAGASGNQQVVGLVAETLLTGETGFVINNGRIADLDLSSFSVGDILYLSDGVTGGFVASTASLAYSSRTNQVGYVLDNGSTGGVLYVNINNEDINLTLTDIERNILEGNVISTGAYEFLGLTRISSTTFSISSMKGWVVENTGAFSTLPNVINVIYPGATGVSPLIATGDSTFVLVDSTGTLHLQNDFPSPQERREKIYLGKVVHPDRVSIQNVNNTVDFDVSPVSMIRDFWTPIGLINQGIVPSANGSNLNFNTSAGTLWGNGIGWTTNELNPNSVSISAKIPASFYYRTQSGGTGGLVTTIDPTSYDVGGVVTPIPGPSSNDTATNQRIYIYPTGVINVLYGQTVYASLTAAVTSIDSETFVEFGNAANNGILIGILSVRKDIAVDGQGLNNTAYAKFTLASKFGETLGGVGGLSTTTLQQAYNNSVQPEITTTNTLGAVTFRRGTTADTDHVFEVQNGSGVDTMTVTGSGKTTTDSLTIAGLGATSGLTRFMVTDTSGNTYYQASGYPVSATPPGSSGAAGSTGELALDTDYLYVCVATNTWKRTSLTGW